MPYLNPLDTAFLRMESKRTPMHVAGLLVFRLPENAGPDFLSQLYERMRASPVVTPPFNFRLARHRWRRAAPAWEEIEDIDLDYHLRHSALPHPGGERELGMLVARLHSHPLDLDKPLWEFHLIEGLENRRFAIYMKAHHAALDGFSALALIKHWLSPDPGVETPPGPWAIPQPAHVEAPHRQLPDHLFRFAWRLGREQLRGGVELGQVLSRIVPSQAHPYGSIVSPWHIPRTPFNTRISQHRRVATQLYDLQRFKSLSAATGATVNDICLTIAGGAMRRYLEERGELPERPLVASIPIGLPRPDGQTGNRTAGFVCPVGTHIADPVKRLRRIHEHTSYTKGEMSGMSDTALNQFTVLGISPLMLGQMSGLLTRLPPLFNLTISNVVASREPLYLSGAELEAMYPISVLFDGHTLNMTIVGYADRLSIGITGCRESIPNLQRLAVYTGDALGELEAAVAAAPAPKRRKSTSSRGGGGRRKAVAK